MRTLPVAIFTHDRTACAMAVVDSLIRNLRCGERRIEWILCDDRSKPGHVAAVVDVFRRAGIEPTVHLNNDGRTGLGAAMNKGLVDAFGRSHECLRIEDDWLLKRPLDLGDWVEDMDKLSIGSLRLGMMFRKPHELLTRRTCRRPRLRRTWRSSTTGSPASARRLRGCAGRTDGPRTSTTTTRCPSPTSGRAR